MSDNAEEPKKRQGERNPGASLQQKLRNHAKATDDEVAVVLRTGSNFRSIARMGKRPALTMLLSYG